MDELIRLCKKAANEWRNTDTYYQAAVLIDSLCERLEKIENRNPYTKADRIRSMTDEELAELIVKHHPMHAWNKQVRKIYFEFDDHRKDNPQRAWLEWLRQPAEGE